MRNINIERYKFKDSNYTIQYEDNTETIKYNGVPILSILYLEDKDIAIIESIEELGVELTYNHSITYDYSKQSIEYVIQDIYRALDKFDETVNKLRNLEIKGYINRQEGLTYSLNKFKSKVIIKYDKYGVVVEFYIDSTKIKDQSYDLIYAKEVAETLKCRLVIKDIKDLTNHFTELKIFS
ncbi:hypothetical protein D3C81_1063620 [compost metagenome]